MCVCACFADCGSCACWGIVVQGEWASIGLADMFNSGGAIMSEGISAGAGSVNGSGKGDVTTVELMVSRYDSAASAS